MNYFSSNVLYSFWNWCKTLELDFNKCKKMFLKPTKVKLAQWDHFETTTNWFQYLNDNNKQMSYNIHRGERVIWDLSSWIKLDPINQLITLFVIPLSGAHCIKWIVLGQIYNFVLLTNYIGSHLTWSRLKLTFSY